MGKKQIFIGAAAAQRRFGTLKKWSTENAYMKALALAKEQKRKKY